MSKVKNNIGKYLSKKGMTQKELAELIGSTEVSISKYVSGDREPRATTCIQIASVLGCEVTDLYGLEDKEKYVKAEFNEIAVFNKCMEIMKEFNTQEILVITSFLTSNVNAYGDVFPFKTDK